MDPVLDPVKAAEKRAKQLKWFKRGLFATLAVSACSGLYILFGPNEQIPYELADGKFRARYRMLKLFPTRVTSRFVGMGAEMEIPYSWRTPFFTLYARRYGIDLNNVEADLTTFRTFQDFFSRSLPIPRIVHNEPIVSPVDGTIQSFGRLDQGKLKQIKGLDFHAKGFLGFEPANFLQGTYLYYITIYLAPGDYHRFHAPCNFLIAQIRHFPGNLAPVNKKWASKLQGLYSINERVVLSGNTKMGKHFNLALVGAFGVGSIELYHDQAVSTNKEEQDEDAKLFGQEFPPISEHPYPEFSTKNPYDRSYGWKYLQPIFLEKGLEMGKFKMGSTAVLIFEEDPGIDWTMKVGDKIQQGQNLFSSPVTPNFI